MKPLINTGLPNTGLPNTGPHPVSSPRHAQGPQNRGTDENAALRKAASELEVAFLAEMLKATGLGKARDAFGGGAGEDQFSSILVRAQAEQMTQAGGIGLAESLYHALLETENDQP